jgi:hypothetical protein
LYQHISSYHDLANQLSTLLRIKVQGVTYLPTLQKVWYFRLCSNGFLQESVQQLRPMLYAPTEHFDSPNTMYINLRGIAAKLGRPMAQGAIWGIDFLLDDDQLFDNVCASALT